MFPSPIRKSKRRPRRRRGTPARSTTRSGRCSQSHHYITLYYIILCSVIIYHIILLAPQGHARAQYNAAWSLLNGRGAPRDPARAAAWLRAAAGGWYVRTSRVS